jgi:hypothetical protein
VGTNAAIAEGFGTLSRQLGMMKATAVPRLGVSGRFTGWPVASSPMVLQVAARQCDQYAMCVHECICHDDKTALWLAPKGRDGGFDLCIAMNGRSDWREIE